VLSVSWGPDGLKDVFWIAGQSETHLAVVLRPRGDEWLKDEIISLKHNGIQTLVSMLEVNEATALGLGREGEFASAHGLAFVSYPIPDTHIPAEKASFRLFVNDLAARLRTGERVGVHCRGSIGRSTLAAACTLIHLGWTPATALDAIEAARGCPVPDTMEQREWILRYEADG
jgi:protein-tyrosine phosphatase